MLHPSPLLPSLCWVKAVLSSRGLRSTPARRAVPRLTPLCSYPFSIVDGKYITGHTDDKAAGVLDMNLGKVPLLYIDGKAALGQSKAIERYLAKQFGFMGATPVEEAQVDMWIEVRSSLRRRRMNAQAG